MAVTEFAELERLRAEVWKRSTSTIPDAASQALDLIDAEAAAGGVTYVHCWGGHGRTGSVVGCYVAREIGGEAALARIAELRRTSTVAHMDAPQTRDQKALVRGWA